MPPTTLQPADVRAAATVCLATLEPYTARDWQRLASGLEWSCRHTLVHTSYA